MMKRLLPSIAVLAATFGAAGLMHCGGEAVQNDPLDGATHSSSGGVSSGNGGGSSGSGNVSSSGGSGTSSGNGGSSGEPDSGGSSSGGNTRIPTKTNLPNRSAGCGQNSGLSRGGYAPLEGGRYYIPYQPADYNNQGIAGAGYPVLVALHGCQADPWLFSSDYMAFQDQIGNGAAVFYGVANNAESTCGWDVGGNSDLAYLDSLLEDIGNKFCIDPSRVLVVGFSWGSYMAHAYACARPGTVKAVVGGAGGYPNGYNQNVDPAICGQIPSLVYGRTADYAQPIGGSYGARDQRKAIANCTGADIGAPMPTPPFNDGSYCTEATNCDGGLFTTFCEDKFDFTSIGGQSSYNHTIYKPWHNPIWQWFLNLP